MNSAKPPIPQTLLPLLEKLLARALAGRKAEGAVQVTAVHLHPSGVTLHLSLERFPSSAAGGYPLHLKIEETTPEHTLCAVELPSAPGLQKMLGLGLKVLPNRIVNEALANFFQGALAMEGDQVRIDHRALLEAMLD